MIRFIAFAAVAAILGLVAGATMSAAGPKKAGQGDGVRRGGYSYSQEDTINTYGDSRSKYGSTNSLRDPRLDTQTNSGPFDHGFFFDSATGARGGDAPYMN
jgi:hypothetical protein